MKPVVCFYKDNLAIYSEEYFQISADKNIFQFLSDIEKKYFEKMKIIQIDFEATSACVFILNTHKVISISDIEINEKIDLQFKPRISKNEFIKKILKIKKDISIGRYYQVNLTSCFYSNSTEDSYFLFKKYFSIFKSKYFAFLPIETEKENFEILCYSPELFLEKSNSILRTEPIKGTVTSNLNHLVTSQKETAELSMIVDLLRNDLNSVCKKPVQVTKHREILDLGYTQHTYSEMTGETNLTLPEILKSTLPGGSISGCPKIESLHAISEIEDQPRGFYTGTIGWWQNSDFKLNIAIRSFKKENDKKNNLLTYYAGCGIVYDSDPDTEWQELLTKAGRLNIQYDK